MLPRTPVEITPSVMASVLKLPSDAITSVERKPLGSGNGNTGALVVKLEVARAGDDGARVTYILKVADCRMMTHTPTQRKSPFERHIIYATGFTDAGMTEAEVKFYRDVAKHFTQNDTLSFPEVYGARLFGHSTRLSAFRFIAFHRRENVAGVLLMEDLSASGQARTFGAVEEAPRESIPVVLRAMAQFHCTTWRLLREGRFEQEGVRFIPSSNYVLATMRGGVGRILKKRLASARTARSALERWGGTDLAVLKEKPEVFEALVALERNYRRNVYPHLRGVRSDFIIHGDFHIGNTFLMPPDYKRVKLFDWQNYGYGNPAWDVNQFFASNVTPRDGPESGDPEEEEEEGFLRAYHAELSKVVEDYSWPAFRRDVDLVLCDYCVAYLMRRGVFETPASVAKAAATDPTIMGVQKLCTARETRLLLRVHRIWRRGDRKFDLNLQRY